MAKLFLLRHLKSQWNLEDRFAGWSDNPVSEEGLKFAPTVADQVRHEKFDVMYTSPLMRCKQTVIEILRNITDNKPLFLSLDGGRTQRWSNYVDIAGKDIPVFVSAKLNERYYGRLQGLNKKETAEKYGEEQVKLWRRSYDTRPPGGESLRDVCRRTTPFYRKHIEKKLKEGKNVVIVASHNSLRAIVKYIEDVPDDKIINVELPFGALITYDFKDGKYTKV